MNIHPDDLLHVILDALNEHQHQIAHGTLEPWLAYSGDDDDPKLSSDGYLAVLAQADARVQDMLSRSIPLPEVDCTCGYGGHHEPLNIRCAANRDKEGLM